MFPASIGFECFHKDFLTSLNRCYVPNYRLAISKFNTDYNLTHDVKVQSLGVIHVFEISISKPKGHTNTVQPYYVGAVDTMLAIEEENEVVDDPEMDF